ncbi:MAG: hypothetical protein HY606_04655 [Planctomycetes bacterium]|nr:hypothetical protein [Planctomycetota bacterium]
MITERENYLKAIEFKNPEWIPIHARLSPVTWHKYREGLEEIVLKHPLIFIDYKKGSINFDEFPPCFREGEYYRDNWGCLWFNTYGGLEGQVVEHPLSDWKTLDVFKPPDPLKKSERGDRDWDNIKRDVEEARKKGLPVRGTGERLFDRLYFLRGFENLMVDFATDDPHLPKLIEMLLDYEILLVNKWLEIGVDIIGFHTDIGTQSSLMINPAKFRKYIKPMFKEIFMNCRNAGVHVYLSSDGNLLEIVDDLIECGVSVHDPQFRANTLEGIERVYKGKMCVNLDLDRQMFPFCKPEDIDAHVREAVMKMDSPKGGLMVNGAIYGVDVPLENIEALFVALEKYCLKGKGRGSSGTI